MPGRDHPFNDLAEREQDPVIVVEHDPVVKGCLTIGIKSGVVRHLVQLPNAGAAHLAYSIADILTRAGFSLEELLADYTVVSEAKPKAGGRYDPANGRAPDPPPRPRRAAAADPMEDVARLFFRRLLR